MIVRGLTVWQPWAHALATRCKRAETRGWRPDLTAGRRLVIHAAARRPGRTGVEDEAAAAAGLPIEWRELVSWGAVIAVAQIECVVRTDGITPRLRSLIPDLEHERRLGDWSPGRWAWVLDDVRLLAEPIPCRGAQGLWVVPDEILAALPPADPDRSRDVVLARDGRGDGWHTSRDGRPGYLVAPHHSRLCGTCGAARLQTSPLCWECHVAILGEVRQR